jgi:CelD/BcsL family acetyltransferase involved in cellulose biosynthesis
MSQATTANGLTLRRRQDEPITIHAAAQSASRPYLISEVDRSDWQALLDQFPHHTVFHRLPWLESIETIHKGKLRLARADANGSCIAVWPVFATRKGPLPILGSPLGGWSTPYLGPLFQPGCDSHAALEAFLKHPLFRRSSYFACKTITTGGQHDVDFKPFGFTNALAFETYCIDLTVGHDALWDNLKSECRSRIRKAGKLGLEIREEHDGSFLDEYWTMSIETFAITHIQPMFTRPFIKEVWRRLHPQKQIMALSAWLDGERIAALVLPYDNHMMYYWTGASYLRHRNIPSHNLLHWTAIQAALGMGIKSYDFISTLGGAGRFKRTFGPQTVHMANHWERTSSRLVNALKVGYEKYLMRRQRVKAKMQPTCDD